MPLRLATLGADPLLLELVSAADSLEGFRLEQAYEVPPLVPGVAEQDERLARLRRVAGQTQVRWEALLDDASADLVLISAWDAVMGKPADANAAGRAERTAQDGSHEEAADARARREEQLRRFVQAGIPLVLVTPPCEMLLGYELEMIRQDSRARLFPYLPMVADAEVQEVAALLQAEESGELGRIEQFVWERFAASDQRDAVSVLAHIARDVLVIRRLVGEINLVSASGATDEGRPLANLTVHLTAANGRITRWSMNPVRDAAGIRLTVVGSSDSRSVWIPDGPTAARSETAERFLDDVQRQLAEPRVSLGRSDKSSPVPPVPPESSAAAVAWEEIGSVLEVTDAVQRSVQRRRAIELYHEQVTEQETFKGIMAAGGCGMLMWVLLLLLIAGLVEGLQLPIRNTILWRLWPAFLFAPLAVFLALQLLQFVFRENGDRRAAANDASQAKK